MNSLYSFESRLAGIKVALTPAQLSYESGIAYMKKRTVIPVKEISSVEPGTLTPSITIETTGGAKHKLNVLKVEERERLYSALQEVLATR